MNFDRLAALTFQTLRQFNYESKLFDEEGDEVTEPTEARRFFAPNENLLISLTDDGDNSAMRVFLSPGTEISSIMEFLDTLRVVATKYNKAFHIRTNNEVIKPQDFATKFSVSETMERKMNILEGLYGTSRSSYLKLENARMIVRHSARINEADLGARGRNIDSIHIENALGERILFPTTQLAPARAMTHHVNNGGTWADEIGQQINRMAADFAHLGAASRHIYTCANELAEGAMGVREQVREGIRDMRRTFEGLCRKTRYAEIAESICQQAQPLTEGADDGLAEAVTGLASLLNTDAVSLSEAVLGSVARILEARGRKSADDQLEYIGLMGHELAAAGLRDLPIKISKVAWEDLKSRNHLDLVGPVELKTTADADSALTKGREISKTDKRAAELRTPSMPLFPDAMTRHCYLLTQIAAKCRDPSMGNLLSFISEERPHLRGNSSGRALGQIFDIIANKAFKAAGVDPESIKLHSRNPEVRALQDWFDSFDADTLVEYDRFEEPDNSAWNHNEAAVDSALARFDVDDFPGSEFAAPIEHEVTREELLSSLAHYLEAKLEDEHEATGVDMSGAAEHLYDQLASAMAADGYTIVDAPGADEETAPLMAAEDCEDGDTRVLSKEDVLLPKRQGDDLANEVEPATVDDPVTGTEREPDDSYLQRLVSLSGIRKTY